MPNTVTAWSGGQVQVPPSGSDGGGGGGGGQSNTATNTNNCNVGNNAIINSGNCYVNNNNNQNSPGSVNTNTGVTAGQSNGDGSGLLGRFSRGSLQNLKPSA